MVEKAEEVPDIGADWDRQEKPLDEGVVAEETKGASAEVPEGVDSSYAAYD
jgi:hypothetical protein